MSHPTPEVLALHWSGDLPAAKSSVINRHLAACPECRRALAGFATCQDLLQSVWPEPSAADLADIRQRVFANLRRPSPKWPFAAVALAGAASIAFIVRLHAPVPPPSVPRINIASVYPVFSPTPQAVKIHLHRTRPLALAGLRSASFLAQADAPPVLKLTTADPRVIVLLPSPLPVSEPNTDSSQSHE